MSAETTQPNTDGVSMLTTTAKKKTEEAKRVVSNAVLKPEADGEVSQAMIKPRGSASEATHETEDEEKALQAACRVSSVWSALSPDSGEVIVAHPPALLRTSLCSCVQLRISLCYPVQLRTLQCIHVQLKT